MSNIAKLFLTLSLCAPLTACQTLGGESFIGIPLSISGHNSLSVGASNAASATIVATVVVDNIRDIATLTYNGTSLSGLVKNFSTNIFSSINGTQKIEVKSVYDSNVVGGRAIVYLATITNNAANLSDYILVANGQPATNLPNGKAQYSGILSGKMASITGGEIKDINGAVIFEVDFNAASVSGNSLHHFAADFSPIAGAIQFSNGKITDGKVIMDVTTSGGFIVNGGGTGGAGTGKADAAFYTGGEVDNNNLLGIGSFDNGSTLGIFGFGSVIQSN